MAEYGHSLVRLWEVLMTDYEVCTVWATDPEYHVRMLAAHGDDAPRGTSAPASGPPVGARSS